MLFNVQSGLVFVWVHRKQAFNTDLSAGWSSGYERRNCDQHSLGLKPTRVIFLCPWERYFKALFLA